MSYADYEQSARDGLPILFFHFSNDTESWRYCTFSEDFVAGGESFQAWAGQIGEIEDPGTLETSNLKLTCPASAAIAQRFLTFVPGKPTYLDIMVQHYDDPDTELISIWHGIVRGASADPNTGIADLNLEPALALFRRVGLRYTYGQSCNHVLGDQHCKINLAEFRQTSAIATISGVTITSPQFGEKPDSWFTGGQIETFAGSRRTVIRHIGDTITLLVAFSADELAPGDVADAFAGCLHDFPTCIAKFGNEDNYGGTPFGPNTNIFSTGLRR